MSPRVLADAQHGGFLPVLPGVLAGEVRGPGRLGTDQLGLTLVCGDSLSVGCRFERATLSALKINDDRLDLGLRRRITALRFVQEPVDVDRGQCREAFLPFAAVFWRTRPALKRRRVP